MKLTAIVALCLLAPAVALAGEGEGRTCDSCINIDGAISPNATWQTVAGSTIGTENSEYTYQFCAAAGETYTFSTCDGPDSGGGSADYDSALSIWSISSGACGTNLACNDDACSGGSSGLLSTVSFVAPADGDYLIVVDGFSSATGNYVMAYTGAECGAVPTQETSWGNVKSIYR